MSNSINKKNFSYAWIIVISCMLIQAIPFGVACNIQPQFVSYVVEENGFTLAGFSLIFTLGTIASAVASPFIGTLFNKINTKVMFLLGAILSGGGFFAFSMCNQLWQFYIVAAIVQIGTAVIASIGVPLVINKWFDESSKGKATGIAFAGSGLGNIFLQQLVVSSLVTNGASKSYMIFGLLSLIVGVPIALLFIKLPKNDSEVVRGNKKDKTDEAISTHPGFTFKEATKLKYFWFFGLGLFFLGMYVSALAVQYPAFLSSDAGFKPHVVASVGSTFALFCLCGNLFGGIIFDKLGVTKGLIVSFTLATVACIALIFSKELAFLAFVFAVTNGLSVFSYMIGPSILTGSFFGQKDFGAILGVTQIFFAVGFAAGSSVFGVLVDNFGYRVAWIVILIFIIIAYSSLIATSISIEKFKKQRKLAK